MVPKFAIGAIVRMTDSIIASAPAYADRTFTILAASAAWGIGQANDWHGDYVIADSNGNRAVSRECCLQLA